MEKIVVVVISVWPLYMRTKRGFFGRDQRRICESRSWARQANDLQLCSFDYFTGKEEQKEEKRSQSGSMREPEQEQEPELELEENLNGAVLEF